MRTIKRSYLILIASIMIFAMSNPFSILAQTMRTVTLAWDANSEPDISHYIVYWGTESGEYNFNSGNIGNVTEYAVTIPKDGNVYYFAVTAVDEAGLESDYSNEVSTEGPNPPNIKIKAVVDVDVNVDIDIQ